jgi:hypothetical protein
MSLLVNYGIRASAGGKTEAPTLSLVTRRQSQIVVRVTNNDPNIIEFTQIRYGSSTFISTDTINANGGTRDFTITGLAINSAVSFIANVNSGKGLSDDSNTLNTSTLAQVAPTISNVLISDTSVTFTVRNNNLESSVIRARVNADPISSSTPSATLNANATGSLTISGLSSNTTYSIRAAAFINNITGPVATTTILTARYTNATGGTTLEYNSGGKRYRSHTFTTSGNFVVTSVGNGDRNQVDYLIIAGGGGGGGAFDTFTGSGGGGAGGYFTTLGTSGRNSAARPKVTVTATSYNVTIGAGGSGTSSSSGSGADGTNSSVAFPTTITASRGGGGASANLLTSRSGGSGGGAGYSFGKPRAGGAGTANQGFQGGGTTNIVIGDDAAERPGGGGGGGAGQSGRAGQNFGGGNGGFGIANTLRTGSNETRAAGGGGGTGHGNLSSGGTGGGGNGGRGSTASSFGPQVLGTNAITNTGSGGGGIGGNGGSGIVVIRYEIAPN